MASSSGSPGAECPVQDKSEGTFCSYGGYCGIYPQNSGTQPNLIKKKGSMLDAQKITGKE